jgi:hypothetical protein
LISQSRGLGDVYKRQRYKNIPQKKLTIVSGERVRVMVVFGTLAILAIWKI